MVISTYQKFAHQTAAYPTDRALEYTSLGLASEAGEVAGKIKKHIRDHTPIDDAWKESVASEIGDVLWYCAELASSLGLSLDDIAKANLCKLADRKKRGVIAGSGDQR